MKELFDKLTENAAPPLVQRHESPYPAMIAAAALVVIMVCAAGYTVWNLHQRVTLETRASLVKLARVVAEQTSRSFQQADLSLQEIADRIARSGLDATGAKGELMHRFLAERMRGLRQVKNLNVTDENGQMINHALSWPAPDLDLSAREHFRYLRDHGDAELFIGEPVRSKLDGEWTLYLARRLNGPQGEFRGVVQAAVRLADFEEFVQSLALGEGNSIQLLRQDGIRLARYPNSSRIGDAVRNRDKLQSGGEIAEDIDPDGVVRYVAIHPVRGFPLAVAAAMTKKAMLGSWRRDAMVMLVGALAAVASVLVLVAIARKVRRLRDSEQLLARQNDSLEQSRYLLHEAQRIGKLGYWITDVAGENAIWSPQMYEISGLPLTTTVNLKAIQSLLHPVRLPRRMCWNPSAGSAMRSSRFRTASYCTTRMIYSYWRIPSVADFFRRWQTYSNRGNRLPPSCARDIGGAFSIRGWKLTMTGLQ